MEQVDVNATNNVSMYIWAIDFELGHYYCLQYWHQPVSYPDYPLI